MFHSGTVNLQDLRYIHKHVHLVASSADYSHPVVDYLCCKLIETGHNAHTVDYGLTHSNVYCILDSLYSCHFCQTCSIV